MVHFLVHLCTRVKELEYGGYKCVWGGIRRVIKRFNREIIKKRRFQTKMQLSDTPSTNAARADVYLAAPQKF